MAEMADHIAKSKLEDAGITVYAWSPAQFSPTATVNIDPDDEDRLVEVLDEFGYDVGEKNLREDNINGGEFLRVKAIKHDE